MSHRTSKRAPFAARALAPLAAAGLVLAAGCAADAARKSQLEQENEQLRRQLSELQAAGQEEGDQPHSVPGFIVGLAASERDFDSGEFEQLLQESLTSASSDRAVRVAAENDEREVAKVRGMLMQQYLAAAEIPIRITNLTFKLQNPDSEFKIGGAVVPRDKAQVVDAGAGAGVRLTHTEPVAAVMERDPGGGYHVPYEEMGGGSGRIVVQTSDTEILSSDTVQRSQRQGDISFNWTLDLKQVHVYRIEGFSGDVGLFLANMRFPGVQSSIAKYQTMRDAVFLFGYGRYATSVVNQIRTPAHITEAFVAPIDQERFDAVQGRMTLQEVLDALGQVAWERCEFVDFAGEEKIWERPAGVPFPFVSRQVSGEDGAEFYLKYSSKGVFLIGDYQR